MKIEGNRPNIDPTATTAIDTKRDLDRTRTERTAATGDQVQVSSAAQLASAAIAAATNAPAVRPEAVARARALLQSGTLGADANKLADSLIDRTIDPK